MAAKIVFIGAGSIIFVKNLIGDCLLTPALRDAHIALLDIDKEKLRLSEQMLKQLNNNINEGRAEIKAYDDQREALRDADFVINAIHVGGYDPCVINDFEIPLKYGLKQSYADTLGMGGIFRGLRTIPVMLQIAKDMEEVCPDAWLLNYTNPMAIVTGAIQKATSIKTVGLCHSVQICVRDLFEGLGMDHTNVKSKIAGINHQAWLLDVHRDGEDLYPEVKRRALERQASEQHDDKVRYEIMNQFGYYVTESTQHTAEYVPYFIKNAYPELLDEYGVHTMMYKNWGQSQADYWQKAMDELLGNKGLSHERTHEYASYIMEAILTDNIYKIGANVMNNGLITNLPDGVNVEVPCLVDGSGITPCYIGDLPPQLAALNRTNINVQELTIEASLTGNKEHVYHAALLDPHTSAELSIADIRSMVGELLEANRSYLPQFEI
ncbi:alpha-glucosidase/alpha-galactosidase [Paenibacillus gorillae]|uniref:alpha-glucosidase/alpha-galactosidase n=1 Tax=Paenibacillus gorillae TaxID=1243662 RepID=UPI0004B0F35C|nr:alpha-glucosidase/alpha-galactosidase [Paenibacillus gorillae]